MTIGLQEKGANRAEERNEENVRIRKLKAWLLNMRSRRTCLLVPSGEMSYQSACPIAQSYGLRITHTAVEANHRVHDVASNVENGHVAHVLHLLAAHHEIISSRLNQVIPESANG